MTKGVLDLFSGAGGASLGVHEIDGLEVVGAVDIDEEACDVYNDNLPLEPWTQDLTEVSYRNILTHFDIKDDDVDIIIGCPPCQSFSTLRDTEPWPDDEPRDELLQTFLRLVDEASPSMVLFENVPGFVTKEDGRYAGMLREWMDANGYGFDLNLVNTADYGIPQRRKRVIGIGVLGAEHDEVEVPPPTHAPKEDAAKSGMMAHRTVSDRSTSCATASRTPTADNTVASLGRLSAQKSPSASNGALSSMDITHLCETNDGYT